MLDMLIAVGPEAAFFTVLWWVTIPQYIMSTVRLEWTVHPFDVFRTILVIVYHGIVVLWLIYILVEVL